MVASKPPATLVPGAFAVNGIVFGVARNRRTQQNPVLGIVGFPAWLAGIGWRGPETGF